MSCFLGDPSYSQDKAYLISLTSSKATTQDSLWLRPLQWGPPPAQGQPFLTQLAKGGHQVQLVFEMQLGQLDFGGLLPKQG